MNHNCSHILQQMISADLDRLDHPQYFQKDFQTEDVLELFNQTSNLNDVKSHQNTFHLLFSRFLKAFQGQNQRFAVGLKWLICIHKCIIRAQVDYLLDVIFKCLKAIQIPVSECRILDYLVLIFIHPYLNYLCRLCLHRKQLNSKQMITSDAQWYKQYNLLIFILKQFQTLDNDYTNPLLSLYPHLQTSSILIKQDAQLLWQQLVNKHNKVHIISTLEMSILQKSVDKICATSQIPNDGPSFLHESQELSSEIVDFFMHSQQKPCKIIYEETTGIID